MRYAEILKSVFALLLPVKPTSRYMSVLIEDRNGINKLKEYS